METKTKRPTKVQLRIMRRMLSERLLLGWAGTMTTPSLRRLVSDAGGHLRFEWPAVPEGVDACTLGYNEVRWNSYCALTDSPWIERLPHNMHDRLFHDIGKNEAALVRYSGFDSRPTLYRLSAAGRRELD